MHLRQGIIELSGAHRRDLVTLSTLPRFLKNLSLHANLDYKKLPVHEASGEARHQFIARIAD